MTPHAFLVDGLHHCPKRFLKVFKGRPDKKTHVEKCLRFVGRQKNARLNTAKPRYATQSQIS